MKEEENKSHNEDNKIVLYWNWRGILTVICGILLGFSVSLFLFTFTLKNTALNTQFYKDNLKKADTYNRLLIEGVPSIILDSTLTGNQISNMLAQKAVIYVIQKSIPAEFIEKEVNAIIDKIAQFLAKPTEDYKFNIDLIQFNSYLKQSSDGLILLSQILPSCKETQDLNQEASKLLNTSISCKETDVNLDEIKKSITSLAVEIEKINTAGVNINNDIKQAFATITNIQIYIKSITDYMWGSLILMMIFIMAIVLLQLKNICKIFRYISLPIGIGSLLVFLGAIVSQNMTLKSFYENLNSNLSPVMQSIINDLIKTNITQFYYYAKTVSGYTFLTALIIYLVFYFVDRKEK